MTMRGFREVGWVAAVAGTALGCYMVNLKVASERANLENVENRIVLAQRDIRVLQTEIGTRGRLEQLERWNVKVLALSAPQAQQFMEGGYQLATLTKPRETIDPAAPVVLAAAPRVTSSEGPDEKPAGSSARDLLHVAGLERRSTTAEPDAPAVKATATAPKAAKPVAPPTKTVVKPKVAVEQPAAADKPKAPRPSATPAPVATKVSKPTAPVTGKAKAKDAQKKQ